jgi:dihydrofolate reductase
MRKLVAAMNMTLDGFCDHTAGIADAELHQYYTDLLNEAGGILYGRTTYELMEYWRPIVANPTGEKATDDFAVAIDRVPKIVFSRTLQHVDWESARVAARGLEKEVAALIQQAGKDIFVGSPSLIAELTAMHLIDEYQLCIHPVIVGSGLPLFKSLPERTLLTLIKTNTFGSGAVLHYYKAGNK